MVRWREWRRESAADAFPTDARMLMSPDEPGLGLRSLLGNTHSFLLVTRALADVIARHCAGAPMEFFDFTLVDHQNSPVSDDYVFVNPLGALDCLNHDESVVDYWHGRRDRVLGVDRFVLDPAKLRGAPALFRIEQWPRAYVVDKALASDLLAHGFTNLVLDEIEVIA
ncbi:imm11 family protein [Subtercola sp. YIM 133946]|uniref:imm11 family protein n=1 Tax=Subtercola sp. YIM 133946 TaxID=3118909 RepID=UPI002F93E082